MFINSMGYIISLMIASVLRRVDEPIQVKNFCRFSGSFEQILDSFVRGNINWRIWPLTKESKIGQNNTENRRNLFTWIGSHKPPSFYELLESSCAGRYSSKSPG